MHDMTHMIGCFYRSVQAPS